MDFTRATEQACIIRDTTKFHRHDAILQKELRHPVLSGGTYNDVEDSGRLQSGQCKGLSRIREELSFRNILK
jgi:hypothetical protein